MISLLHQWIAFSLGFLEDNKPIQDVRGTQELRPRANVESKANLSHQIFFFLNRRMNGARFAASKFDSN